MVNSTAFNQPPGTLFCIYVKEGEDEREKTGKVCMCICVRVVEVEAVMVMVMVGGLPATTEGEKKDEYDAQC